MYYFTWKLELVSNILWVIVDGKAEIIFITEETKETVLDFSQGFCKVILILIFVLI